MCELADDLVTEETPSEALRLWLKSNVAFVATKKGMSTALALAVDTSSELTTSSVEHLTRAVGSLLARAAESGEIRADIGPEDVLRALVGMCYMHDRPGWQDSVLRMLDVFVDGLCARAQRQRSPATFASGSE